MRSKGFTLIEMLIVITVIAVLATALIVKLKWMEEVSRDTWRIAQMVTLSNALSSYYLDFEKYPNIAFSNAQDNPKHLVPKYLRDIPVDPNANMFMDDFQGFSMSSGNYVLMAGENNLEDMWKLMIIAKMETPRKANFAMEWAFENIQFDASNPDWDKIKNNICKTAFTKVASGAWLLSDTCDYEDADNLRYVILLSN